MRFTKQNRYSAGGMDDAEFYLSTNPGEALRPMGLAASGGELSRIMLVIKTNRLTLDNFYHKYFNLYEISMEKEVIPSASY